MPTINKSNKIKQKTVKYRHTKESSKYYNSKQWHNLRNYYIKQHPLCERCLEHDRVTPAEEVHHMCAILSAPIEYREEVLTDEDNIVALCKECHHEVHNKHDKKYLKGFGEWYDENYPPL
jgi:5-methylcytosine-specific restriction protein A